MEDWIRTLYQGLTDDKLKETFDAINNFVSENDCLIGLFWENVSNDLSVEEVLNKINAIARTEYTVEEFVYKYI